MAKPSKGHERLPAELWAAGEQCDCPEPSMATLAGWRSGQGAAAVGTTAEEGRGLVNREINMTQFLEASFPSGLVPVEARDVIVSVYEADAKLKTNFDIAAEYSWLGEFHGSESWLLFSDPEVIASRSSRLFTLYKALRGAIGQFVREPEKGTGRPEVGALEDVAVWGDIGGVETAGYTAVNRSVVDARCGLYTQLYQAIESVVG